MPAALHGAHLLSSSLIPSMQPLADELPSLKSCSGKRYRVTLVLPSAPFRFSGLAYHKDDHHKESCFGGFTSRPWPDLALLLPPKYVGSASPTGGRVPGSGFSPGRNRGNRSCCRLHSCGAIESLGRGSAAHHRMFGKFPEVRLGSCFPPPAYHIRSHILAWFC